MSRFFIAAACLVLLAYGAFEARRLVEGPQITITSPQNGAQTASSTVTVTGVAENIAFLTINGAPAFTDTKGNFAVTVAPPNGYNVFTISANDRFGRHTTKTVAFTVLTYCPT